MLEVTGAGSETATSAPYFIFCTPQRVPRQAWTRVPLFGKLSGQLLNPGGYAGWAAGPSQVISPF